MFKIIYNITTMIELDISKLFLKKRLTLAIAESCTGGLLSNLVTNIAGSSKYFILGVTSYSNKAKTSVLKIPEDVMVKNGAVSNKVARLMAKSIKKIADTNFGIGVTGIAGPQGGSKIKPVGTVFIAIDGPTKKICQRFYFKGTRLTIRRKAAYKALELLKQCLKRN